eukprot:TRINITY_DN64217_c0_g1_i1.p1 TRINITY_DN64217_c0_g1~~TRINITY_DN64217_c0_g1_i1.p1  ORF type:complete len:250 (+),score=36.13 TRINITY_DN64217_c0_g1_i1:77-826(+)
MATGSSSLYDFLFGCCCTDQDATDTQAVVSLDNATGDGEGSATLTRKAQADKAGNSYVQQAPNKYIAEPAHFGNGDASTNQYDQFVVELQRTPDRAFGLNFHSSDGQMLIITEVLPGGLLNRWNDMCLPSQVVRPWDCLYRVNGRSGFSQELVAQLKNSGRFELHFRRPRESNVSVTKNGKVLGLLLSPTTGAGLYVQDVQAGAAMDAGAQVKAGDHIVAVNGHRTSAMDMIEMIKTSDVLNLKVLSYR